MLTFFDRKNGKNPPVNGSPYQGMHGLQTLLYYNYSDTHMEFARVKEFVLQKLSRELKPSLYYHNTQHTIDVCRSVETLAIMEKVSEEELLLLLTAAIYHDTGFIWSYDNNEPLASKFARRTLPEFGYTPIQISIVSQLIASTAMPQQPETLLEEILCDADLDYIGREDFFITALRLHREWSENSARKITFRDWYEKQRDFVETHKFFTKSASLLRNEKKKKNLSQVRELLDLIESTTDFNIKKANNTKKLYL